ncbi:MAG: hypothetical protein KAW41_06190 [Candidatus Diapherotrites archaeon]|nr:hypothetical protein [Candidatus Diapherotrites archaeon]
MGKILIPLFEERHGAISIDVHRGDYAVKKVKDSTYCFLERLLKELAIEITGKTVPIRHKSNEIQITIKNKLDQTLSVYGHEVDSYSRAVQLSDVMLGMYTRQKSACSFVEEHTI